MRFLNLGLMLLTSVAFAQAASDSTTPTPVRPAQPGTAPSAVRSSANTAKASEIGPNTPVITIHGLCDVTPAPSKPGAASAKAKKVAICKTIITRAQFDQLANALQPNMDAATKHQLAVMYPKLLLMQREFRAMGLEKDPQVKQALDFARLRAQGDEVARKLQQQAEVVSEEEIEQYYKSNSYFFDTADLLRLYVPKQKRETNAGAETDAAQDAMKKEADALQARAAAGEDFTRLQDEAYVTAGIAGARPPVNMGRLTANELPPNQRAALDLKPGEVSPVIVDNGYYIFKVISKDEKPLSQVQTQISNIVAQQKFTKLMQQVDQSGRTELNEDYFPAAAAGTPTTSPALFGPGANGLGSRGFGNRGFTSRFGQRKTRFAMPAATQPGVPQAIPR
jgi:hypothetical protein